MPFPSIRSSRTTNGTTATNAPVVGLPLTRVVGDVLLALIRVSGASGVTWPSGWHELNEGFDGSDDDVQALAWRKVDGTESNSVTLSVTGSGKFAAIVECVQDAADPDIQPPVISSNATGDPAVNPQPDPPSFTPAGGRRDYLWLGLCGMDGEATVPPTFPGFPWDDVWDSADSGTAGTSTNNLRVALFAGRVRGATVDPPAFVYAGATRYWTATTVACYPKFDDEYLIIQDSASAALEGVNVDPPERIRPADSGRIGLQTGVISADVFPSPPVIFAPDTNLPDVHISPDEGARLTDGGTAQLGLGIVHPDDSDLSATMSAVPWTRTDPAVIADAYESTGSAAELVEPYGELIAGRDVLSPAPVLLPVDITLARSLTETLALRDTVSTNLSIRLDEALRVSDSVATWLHLVEVVKVADSARAALAGAVVVVAQSISVELELSAGIWTDVTQDVAIDEGIQLAHGLTGTSYSDRVGRTPTAAFHLVNSAGTRADGTTRPQGFYSLFHANTCAGWALNIRCRVRLYDEATAQWHVRFLGRVDTADVSGWDLGRRRVAVTAVGWLEEAARWALIPDIGEQVDKRADEILTSIVAAMPVPPFAQSFDQGREIYPYALDQSSIGQSAYTEFAKLAASEFGYVFEQPDGTLRFEGRHQRLVTATSQWTITDAEIQIPDSGLRVVSARDQVLNTIRTTIHPKVVDVAPTTVVYTQTNPIRIPYGTEKLLMGEFRDPVTGDPIGATDIQPMEVGIDYAGNDVESGMGIDRTSDLQVTANLGPSGVRFAVVNIGSADAWLTVLQLRGRGIYDHQALTLEARNAASVATYGERVLPLDMPYQWDAAIGQGAADYVLTNEALPIARAQSVTVFSRDAATKTQILTRQISDMVTVQNPLTGVSSDVFINGITLTVTATGIRATYELVRLAHEDYWVLGVSTLGVDTIPAPF